MKYSSIYIGEFCESDETKVVVVFEVGDVALKSVEVKLKNGAAHKMITVIKNNQINKHNKKKTINKEPLIVTNTKLILI